MESKGISKVIVRERMFLQPWEYPMYSILELDSS